MPDDRDHDEPAEVDGGRPTFEVPAPGPRWPDAVLALRLLLPSPPRLDEIVTDRLTIAAYEAGDATELHAITDGRPVARMGRSVDRYDAEALVWRFMHSGPFATVDDLASVLGALVAAPDAQVLTVRDRATEEVVGSLSLLANVARDLRVEIGNVFFSPAVQGLGAGREANRAVIDALVDRGYQRIEWKCNDRNLRSRRAAEALGFAYEGTFRAHMVVKGRRRDTAWYSLVPADRAPTDGTPTSGEPGSGAR